MRKVVAVDAGCSVQGMSMPYVDPDHPQTVLAGFTKRVGAKLPSANKNLLRKARNFVINKMKEKFTPLPPDTDLSVDTWLDNSSYTTTQKEKLRQVERFEPGLLPQWAYNFKSFIKGECYPEWKYARTIQGPTDEAKVHFGPVISALEKSIFKDPSYVKKIPVSERPAYILNRLGTNNSVAASDFSSFEVSWQKEQMEAFEFPVIDFFLQNLPNGHLLMKEFRKIEAGTVKLIFKYVTAVITSTRKSGTMNTSASNGAGNWLIHEFAAEHLGLGELIGVFEGDDGLFRYSSGKFPTPEFYQELGFAVKLQIHSKVSEASFCGLVFDELEVIGICDPVSTLVKFGWIGDKYAAARSGKKLALLRCKAMSLASQYPRAPVVAACADWILRMTAGIDTRWVLESNNLDTWTREKYRAIHVEGKFVVDRTEPGMRTRLLMENVFGFSVASQLALERWFDKQTTICQIPLPFDVVNPIWVTNDLLYTRNCGVIQLLNNPLFPNLPDEMPAMITEDGRNLLA